MEGMREVVECEYGGLDPKDWTGGPQATGTTGRGRFGGNNADPAPLGKRYPVGSNVVSGARKASQRKITDRR